MKNLAWLVLVCGVAGGIYYYYQTHHTAPNPPQKASGPTATVESIKYRDNKDGTEERIVSLMTGPGCVRGKLRNNNSLQVMHSYGYHRDGRVITLADEKGAVAGVVLVT